MAFYHVGGASRSGPRPAVIADFGGVIEVVERDEVSRQVVLIRRVRLSKLGQIRIAIADFQVTQNLVVGPVFLDDEDDVLDPLTHGRHDRGVIGAIGVGEPVVQGYLRRQRRELRRVRAREGLEAGFDQLGIVLIRYPGIWCATVGRSYSGGRDSGRSATSH